MLSSILHRLNIVFVVAAVSVTFHSPAQAAVDPTQVPEAKRSKPALYVEAKDAPALLAAANGRVLFVDIRTRSEAMYVGMAGGVDALVPFVEHEEMMTTWDEKRGVYALAPLQDFVPEMDRRLAQKGLTKNDLVVLICRSGDRSARGATRLMEAGYGNVYSVIDGLEGDMSKDGRRSVNGWKNAGLPWSYKLEKQRMYFPK